MNSNQNLSNTERKQSGHSTKESPSLKGYWVLRLAALSVAFGATVKAQTLGEALDATNLTWTTSGAGMWISETSFSHDGVAAAQCSPVLPGQASTLQTSIQGPGTLRFWWSEMNGTVSFKVDDTELRSLSSFDPFRYVPSDWIKEEIYLASGSQDLQWVHSYPLAGAVNSNACWIDEVSFSPGATAPLITLQPASLAAALGFNVEFTVDAIGTPPMGYQWRLHGVSIPGATSPALTVTNVTASEFGLYSVKITNAGGATISSNAPLIPGNVAVWGRQDKGQVSVPASASNSIALSAGAYHSLALCADGTVVGWGDNTYGQTAMPAGLTNVAAVAAGTYHNLALRADGTVAAWGQNVKYNVNLSYPANSVDSTNIVGIAGGDAYSMTLKADGTVAAWGEYRPSDWTPWYPIYVPPQLTNAVAISGGRNHVVVLKADGTVLAWGRDAEGQTDVPPGLTNIVAVAAGAFHCLALGGDGSVTAWGANNYGQVTVPTNLVNVVAIAAGADHSLALQADGRVVAWGTNDFGQTVSPAALTSGALIAAGGYHSLALLRGSNFAPFLASPLIDRQAASGGTVLFYASATGDLPLSYQWQFNGTNLPGGTTPILSLLNVSPAQAGPYQLLVLNSYGATTSTVAVLTVYDFSGALNTTNTTWSPVGDPPWFVETAVAHDRAAAAQSGVIVNNQTSTLHTAFTGPGVLTFWWKVSSEAFHDFLSVKVNGTTQDAISGELDWQQQTVYLGSGAQVVEWTYAKDASGSAGQDAGWLDQVSYSPGPVAPLITTQPVSVSQALGLSAVFSVTAGGMPPLTYQWRLNGRSIPGATSPSLTVTNVQVSDLGTYSVLVMNQVGTAFSHDATLTLAEVLAWGSNSYGQTNVPPDLTSVAAVAGGWHHSVALRTDGTVSAWGANNKGQTNVPTGLTNVIAIASRSGDHSMALRSDGTVVVWGDNSYGQTNVPVGLSNVVAISAGGARCLALKANGTAVSWGDSTSVPAGLSNVVAIAAGDFASLFLRSDGTVAAVGTGVPAGLSNIVRIAAGGLHNLALRADGALIAWGDNSYGQTSVPSGLTQVIAIAAGDYHSLALRVDGTVAVWGQYYTGSSFVPALPSGGLTNVLAIAAGSDHDLAFFGTGSPPPDFRLANPAWSGGRFSVSVPTQSGEIYRLEFKNALTDTPWSTLPLTAGNGREQVLSDSTPLSAPRFYRVSRW